MNFSEKANIFSLKLVAEKHKILFGGKYFQMLCNKCTKYYCELMCQASTVERSHVAVKHALMHFTKQSVTEETTAIMESQKLHRRNCVEISMTEVCNDNNNN